MGGVHQAKDESAGGSIGEVTIVGGGVPILDGVDDSIKATVKDLTNANPLTVAIVDASGDQITSFGGGTQYTEGDTDATITGTAILWEDGSDTLRPVSASKPLPTQLVSALPAGTNAIGKLAANSGVDIGDVDVTSVIPGTGATNLGKAVDSAAGGTDTGVAPLFIRDDALSSLTPVEGDYVPGRVDANGNLWVSLGTRLSSSEDSITAESPITDIGHGVKTVTTAGTDVALAASTACKKVVIQAQTDNTGWIAVGASGVDATESTGTGVLLGAGDAFELDITDLANVFIDSTVNGEGVRYTYFT